MDFLINDWIDLLITKIKKEYEEHVLFIGLQGSYKRKEATKDSDIDVVVILDKLDIENLKKYREIIAQMPYKEKACGFISGKYEILSWERAELFQFYYDTLPLYGSIDFLLPLIDKQNIKQAVKVGACNLYHACCHSFVYENRAENLPLLYKSAFFILQAKYFDETNQYVETKTNLVNLVKGIDKEILTTCLNRENLCALKDSETDFYYEKIISWCSNLLQTY